jgi:hypothetical protein
VFDRISFEEANLKWRVFLFIVMAFIANAIVVALAIAIMLESIWAVAIILASSALGFYWIFIRFHKKRKPRYPLVPPEGKPDVYLPRTDIPRPIFEDFRRMEEKKRKLEKLKKLSRKKKQTT